MLRHLALAIAQNGAGQHPVRSRAVGSGLFGYVGHLGVECYVVPKAEVIDVVIEVPDDLTVVRKHGIIRRHGVVAVGHHQAVGVDVQRAIGRRQAVVIVVAPVAANARPPLETVEVDAVLVECFGHRNARCPRPNNANRFHNELVVMS